MAVWSDQTHADQYVRLWAIHQRISDNTNPKQHQNSSNVFAVRRDLLRIWNNCRDYYSEMDKEAVQCRRLSRVTVKYEDMAVKLEQMLYLLEKRITWGVLSI